MLARLFGKTKKETEPLVNVNVENNVRVITGGRQNWSKFKPFESVTDSDTYLRLTHSMMKSEAWHSLSIHARYLYIEMKAKFNGSNESDISFTYKEGQGIMNDKTFTKSIDQLIETGFIKLLEQNWTTRRPNIYGFSEMWKLYGTNKFSVESRVKRKEQIT